MATVRDTLRSPGTPDQQSFIVKRILRTLTEQNECSLEELIEICGAGTSNQILLEVDRLDRIGEICLLYKKDGGLAVTLARIPVPLEAGVGRQRARGGIDFANRSRFQ